MLKKYSALIMAASVLMCASLSGCGESSDGGAASSKTESKSDTQSSASTAASETKKYDLKELGLVADYYDDQEHEVGYQLESPDEGEEVAIMHTSMGDISMRFFPEAAPKTVENFLTHAKNGYYDGLTFHRVINEFMIQGGDPKGDGTGGESVSGGKFEDEFSNKLFNIRGSVAMANSGTDTNGSQFFINQAKTVNFDMIDQQWKSVYDSICQAQDAGQLENFLAMYGMSYNSFYNADLVSEDIRALYNKEGGNPSLDGAFNVLDRGHTVFAQVYSGMDVVDKIAAVETDSANKPTTPVTIDSIEVVKYSK
ncbi:MAG: peptidylprolyl isomerase [Clostridia bacterium]|nr:peptidylprolyl isomerase [Clostridia bacterium]